MALDEERIRGILKQEMDQAIAFCQNSEISQQRKKSFRYYLGQMDNDLPEVEGRSTVVSYDVADTVESIMPQLMKIFASGDQVVRFDPVGEEDEQQAEEKTEYINHVFMKDNEGFEILYVWFKDALLGKNGFIKSWWEEYEESTVQAWEGLTEDALAILMNEAEGLEPLRQNTYPVMVETGIPGQPPQQIMLTDLQGKLTRTCKRIHIENIPPEEFVISPWAKSIKDAGYCAHITQKTVAQVREMFPDIPVEELYDLSSDESTLNTSQERVVRFEVDGMSPVGNGGSVDKSSWLITYAEHYIKIDEEENGYAQLRMITTLGQDCEKIADDVEIEDVPVDSLTPIIMGHRFFGRSVAELVEDIQRIKTALQRQILDNLYLTNNVRNYVDENAVTPNTIADLLDSRPGGLVRGKGPNAVTPLQVQPIGRQAYDQLEYLDTLKENRVGVTRYNQGMDADSLNKTATGINAIMGAAQERLLLIARIFAETGVKSHFQKLLKLTIKHQDVARQMRMRGKWVEIDPRTWNANLDLTVVVGLGTGNKDQMAAHLLNLYNMQKEAMPLGLAGPENIYNLYDEFCENIGLKNADAYFTNPEENPPQPQQDPAAQAAQQQMQMEQQQAQAQMAMEQQKIQAEMAMRMQIEQAKIESNERIQMAKLQAEIASKKEIAMIQAQTKLAMPPSSPAQ